MMLAPFISRVRRRFTLILLIVTGGILGMLPDLLGLFGYLVDRSGEMYGSAHAGPLKEMLQYIPMYALHLAVDSLTHDPHRQWYGWNMRVWLQILFWMINIAGIIWFGRIWKKNREIGS
jgi:hypothetical protein